MPQLLVAANVVLSSVILFTLMMEVTQSSETSVLTRAMRHHIKEGGILHSRRRENLKSYIVISCIESCNFSGHVREK
jgi:hypothetical protein